MSLSSEALQDEVRRERQLAGHCLSGVNNYYLPYLFGGEPSPLELLGGSSYLGYHGYRIPSQVLNHVGGLTRIVSSEIRSCED
jgi:hypothetical protein